MPFTPFHVGPGAAIKAIMPRHFSFTVFCFAQIVTDIETAFYLFRGEYPLHRIFHTYLGATIVAIGCVLIGRPICQAALRTWGRWRNAPFKRYFSFTDRISLTSAVISAFIATYSHVFLDSIMHADVEPLSPWSAQNPFYQIISLLALHALCFVLGVLGTLILVIRSTTRA
jgi:hypothetical protein